MFLIIFAVSARAVTLLPVPQGGTGIGSVTTGSYLKGAGTGSLVARTPSEVKTDLSLNNVENTALSTWAGTTNITTLGTIGTGIWNGTAIADGYISSAGNWNTAYGWGDHSTEGYLTGNETITLSGDISGSGATAITTIIGADKVHDSMIDWGTGASQVNSDDIPDHNSHTIRDTFVDIINRGKSEEITITLTGGLGVSWTAGELYDRNTNTFFSTDAGSGNVTDNAVNYLKWVSGTTLTLSTTGTSGDEILIATGSVYDGNINCYRETSLMNETVANTRRGLRALFPTRVISGMSVHEDTDVTNPLDVTMDAGVFYKDAIEKKTPIEIKSRTIAMIRNFHTAGVWDSDTNAQIETTNYDNGTDLTAIPASKYVKGLFIFMCDNIGFVYPTEYFNTIAQAQDAALPTLPPGLEPVPKLTAIVYQQGDTDFSTAIWQDVRAGISEESFAGVTAHSALTDLAWTSSAHSGDVNTFAGFDNSGVASYYTEANYLLTDGSRNLAGAWDMGSQNLTNVNIDSGVITGITDLAVADGGTGKSSWTQYLIPYADTTTSFSQIAIGTSDQVLTSNGAGLAPTFQDAAAGGQILYDAIVAPSGGDYTDIQSAINAGKHKIFVRAGTYTLSADITFAADETVIVGESWDTVIACGASYKININAKSNCLISGIKVTGTQTTNGLIYSASGGSGIVEKCYIDGVLPIELSGNASDKIFTVRDNFITGSSGRKGIVNYYGTIQNNFMFNFGTSTSGVDVYGTNGADIISGNYFYNIGGTNTNNVIVIRGGDNVIDNHIENVVANSTKECTGIYRGVSVIGNYLKNIGTTSDDAFGIDGGGITKSCFGNYIDTIGNGSATTAIGIKSSIGSYSSNYIDNITATTTYGIQVIGSSTVSGNYLGNSTGTTEIAIKSTDYDDCIITENHIKAGVWGSAIDTGTKFSIVKDNLGASILDESDMLYMKNTDGDAMAVGDLVILKSVAAGNEVTHTTTLGDDKVFGMVTETIANNASGYIKTVGKVTQLKVNGTDDIAIGDFIGTSTTAGIGVKASAGNTAIAIALEAYTTDDSAGVIDALLIKPKKVGFYLGGTNLTLSGSTFNVDDSFILNTGDIGTGVYDFGGATSFEIPNGASPTVDAIGEVALDTTSDQLVYYGSAKRVLQEEDTKCFTIESLAAADDNMEIFMADDAVTITAIGLHCAGTCTTGADISLEDRAGNAMTHTVPTHSTGSGNTTFQAVTAANTLVAGEGLRFDVDNAVSPETDTYLICFKVKYTSD